MRIYKATLQRGKVVHLGDSRYEQHQDKTPLKLYSSLDHHDKKRIDLYYKRHPTTFVNILPNIFRVGSHFLLYD